MRINDSFHKLEYIDMDGFKREVGGCSLRIDPQGRHWLFSKTVEQNIAYKIKNREDALICGIDSLLHIIKLRSERIQKLQRIVDLAERFAMEAFPSEGSDE